MKISKRQLRKIINENIFDDAREYASSAYDYFFGGYKPGDVIEDFDDWGIYKEEDGRWLYKKKDSPDDPWRPLNREGSEKLTRYVSRTEEPDQSTQSVSEEREVKKASDVYPFLVAQNIINEGDTLLLVDGVNQKFYLKRSSSESVMSGDVSTGVKGFGNETNSGKTSTGLMKVSAIKGRGLESGTVLVGKAPTNPPIILGPRTPSPRPGHTAEVLSRALVLSGLETKNRNVINRNIYVHGTNREHHLGSRASGGCIRMSSKNIIKLADVEINNGDFVYVFDGPASISSTLIGNVASLIDRGIQVFTEEKLEKTLEEEDVKKVDGKDASDEEVLSILSKYPAEENA